MYKEIDSFLFLSMNLHTNRQTAVAHHKLIVFADTELQVIIAAPCDQDLYDPLIPPDIAALSSGCDTILFSFKPH